MSERSILQPLGQWSTEGACRTLDLTVPERVAMFFPESDTARADLGRASAPAKAVCATCPVRGECLLYAVTTHVEDGIWGGTTPDVRKQIRRWLRLTHARPTPAIMVQLLESFVPLPKKERLTVISRMRRRSA